MSIESTVKELLTRTAHTVNTKAILVLLASKVDELEARTRPARLRDVEKPAQYQAVPYGTRGGWFKIMDVENDIELDKVQGEEKATAYLARLAGNGDTSAQTKGD